MFSLRKKTNSLNKLSALVLAVFMLFGAASVSAKSSSYVYGLDTVAGEETLLKANGYNSNQNLVLHLVKPDGIDVSFSTKTNQAGEAVVVVESYHTKLAGTYFTYADNASKTSFTVFSGDISEKTSQVEVDRSVVKADGNDSANVKVKLLDANGNAIEGKALKILPDKSGVVVKPKVGVTNNAGEVDFSIFAEKAGVVDLTVMETGDDLILENHPQISFVNDYVADIGGDGFIQIANAADAGPLSGFEITDLPANIKPSENISFKVKAVDADSVTVQDYTGTIRFSAEGDNSSGVALPANYKFLAEDLGQHEFNLGLSFAKAGTYKIIVNDLTDKLKKGEVTVVVSSGTVEGSGSSTTNKAMITAPAPGTYSQAEQTVTGTAKPSTTVKIFDNNKELASIPVGTTGKFNYQTPALESGKHSIYVVNVDSISLEVISNSDPVEINIDTDAPALDDITLDPSEGIKPGDVINVKVFSESKLSQVALLFNYDIVQLNASLDDDSVYVGTIQAPADVGEYKMGVLLVDELGNEKTYDDQATVTVTAAGDGTVEKNPELGPDENTTPEETVPTDGQIEPAAGAPSQVSGLIAYGSDKRVTLVWDAATDDKKVQNYKVYYGDAVQNMTQVVLTKDASTTWYVPNLQNGKEYFFAVAAIDDEGNESSTKSEIVSGIPFVLEIKNALTEVPTKPLDDGLRPAAYNGPFPQNTTKTGPELMLLVGASGAFSSLWFSRKKKK